MVGGGGERKTLRLVAKYADACNVFAGRGAGTDQVAHKLGVLREWCEREGREYDEIRRTVLYNGLISPDAAGGAAFVEEMRALADLGVQEVHVMPLQGDPVGFVQGARRARRTDPQRALARSTPSTRSLTAPHRTPKGTMSHRTLVVLAHPDLDGSRVNRALARSVRDLDGVTVRDLAEVRGGGTASTSPRSSACSSSTTPSYSSSRGTGTPSPASSRSGWTRS